MDNIPFPSSYKQALLKGTKNATIRVDNEIDKYQVGKTYRAISYSGSDWQINVKIDDVTKIKIKDLHKYGIPKRSVDSFKKKVKTMTDNDFVDILKFHICSD